MLGRSVVGPSYWVTVETYVVLTPSYGGQDSHHGSWRLTFRLEGTSRAFRTRLSAEVLSGKHQGRNLPTRSHRRRSRWYRRDPHPRAYRVARRDRRTARGVRRQRRVQPGRADQQLRVV